jgi:hypothetical protein
MAIERHGRSIAIITGVTNPDLVLVHKCKPKYKLIALIARAIGCEIAKIDDGWYSPIITVLLMNYASHPVWWVAWSIVNLTYTAW